MVTGKIEPCITAKKASMNREFPFTVHRRVGTHKRKSFVFVHRRDFNPDGHSAVSFVHFTAECFTQPFYEIGTRKYLKPGSVPLIRKKNISNHISAGSSNGEQIFISVCANITCTCTVRYTLISSHT